MPFSPDPFSRLARVEVSTERMVLGECLRLSKRAFLRVPFVVLIFAAGCGFADYELRLNESKKYFTYLEKVEQSLAPKWAAPSNLMELRVPRQFNLIPPPPPVKKDDEKVEEPIDQRQPDYMNLTLPGLFGAWEASLKVASPNGGSEERKGYIYAISNYWEFAGDHAPDAGDFVNKVKELLAEKLKIPASDMRQETYPKLAGSYLPQIPYDVCTFKGADIDGANYTFEMYARTQGSVIGVVVTVLPEGMDAQQKVLERVPLMLETFNFTKTPPKAGADKDAPVQPNAGGPGF